MKNEYIGYIKYEGKSVENGIFDARKSAQALLGFDQAIRYFAAKEEPYLLDKDYELPVEIKKDSWDIFLPMLQQLMTIEGAVGIAATTYITKSAAKAATDGLFETGLSKDVQKIFQGAILSMQWVVKIAKHVGSFKRNLQIKHNLEEDKIEIESLNHKSPLIVPRKYFEQYKSCPENILDKLAENITEDRVLKIGTFDQEEIEEVEINETSKSIFYSEQKSKEDDDDTICPELQDGDHVELEGTITKVNEKANTLGFQYKDYILTIEPASNNVTEYKGQILSDEKKHIFRKTKISGIVSRIGKKGEFLKKPRIIFSSLVPIEEEKERTLFDKDNK
jgi:hypothetical protein